MEAHRIPALSQEEQERDIVVSIIGQLENLKEITTDPIRKIGYGLAINALGMAETTHKKRWWEQERRTR